MKDYYYLLGIGHQATSAEVKQAYRKLAAKFHPDANNGDPWFSDRFKEIQAAYQTLSNAEDRKEFDEYWHSFLNSEAHENNKAKMETLIHREEVLAFKEEVLRIKQGELEDREVLLQKQQEELLKWYNKYAVTRFMANTFSVNETSITKRNQPTPAQETSSEKHKGKFKPIFFIPIVCLLGISWIGINQVRTSPKENISVKSITPLDTQHFQGQIGNQDVVVDFNMLNDSGFQGKCVYINDSKITYQLTGNYLSSDEIHLKGFQNRKLISKMILNRTSNKGPICYEGQMYEKDGSRFPVHICEQPR